MSDAIIPALRHRIPSELRSEARLAIVVLGWVTSWEVLVLHSFFEIFFASLHGIYNYGVSKWW